VVTRAVVPWDIWIEHYTGGPGTPYDSATSKKTYIFKDGQHTQNKVHVPSGDTYLIHVNVMNTTGEYATSPRIEFCSPDRDSYPIAGGTPNYYESVAPHEKAHIETPHFTPGGYTSDGVTYDYGSPQPWHIRFLYETLEWFDFELTDVPVTPTEPGDEVTPPGVTMPPGPTPPGESPPSLGPPPVGGAGKPGLIGFGILPLPNLFDKGRELVAKIRPKK